MPDCAPHADGTGHVNYDNRDVVYGGNSQRDWGHITLDPGDLIATGTPAGVGVFRDPPVFLEPGDRVRCEIEGIGTVENPIVDWMDDPRKS